MSTRSATPGAQDDVGDVRGAGRRVDARLDRVALDGEVIAEQPHEVFGTDVPPSLQRKVVQGHPAYVLVEESKGAELLVVGSRGFGGFTDALLGSVSTYCVHHAHGPVTIVRPA